MADEVDFSVAVGGPEIDIEDEHAMIDVTEAVRQGSAAEYLQLTCNPLLFQSQHL